MTNISLQICNYTPTSIIVIRKKKRIKSTDFALSTFKETCAVPPMKRMTRRVGHRERQEWEKGGRMDAGGQLGWEDWSKNTYISPSISTPVNLRSEFEWKLRIYITNRVKSRGGGGGHV